jgi:hypothetical protein
VLAVDDVHGAGFDELVEQVLELPQQLGQPARQKREFGEQVVDVADVDLCGSGTCVVV